MRVIRSRMTFEVRQPYGAQAPFMFRRSPSRAVQLSRRTIGAGAHLSSVSLILRAIPLLRAEQLSLSVR